MPPMLCSTAARLLRAACISSSMVASLAFAQATNAPDAANAANAAANVPAPSAAGNTARLQPDARPLWTELTPAQQQALAPLSGEWDRLDGFRKNKWLAIGNKFASMKPDEQQRMHERMRDWVKLTPEERRTARTNYARAKQLGPDRKNEQWEKYQQLPEDQKKELADSPAPRKRVTTLPSPSAQRNASATLPPIKAAPKPVHEQSVTPKVTSQSAISPAAAPSK
ncbi:DUF3106 domain-containing protein [Noviherbaspirillum sp. CPCC 100848]|uniref:DUF3106 domain-containing protein n=1 Tax=Noviherbaspirillum album TaxID=3080276 RepID=A0ABU6JBW5_9BURK|nr:DUF3106 domain-containing protein [Noviherbaspirillum sp. CPCC 100848]MEC4721035.1 DUF3106 domain-containing protein [Noviherbaspirillum sp. CPCC 100848]